ncbi:hypothetical protein [Mycobacterium paragordonae]|uniref:hypothetical protein n=1 Tax=Mycobacterium paragordonae TaxID=1389713 RepID=UPI0012E18E09|nr:hypothetical protein [Mycobacterium paragordonae]
MTLEERGASPDGRFIIRVEQLEARAFQWVDFPQLVHTATGLVLVQLTDPGWHLDSADCCGESVAIMRLRHFPDGLPSYEVRVDCGQLTASVDGGDPRPLAELEEMLETAATGRTR